MIVLLCSERLKAAMKMNASTLNWKDMNVNRIIEKDTNCLLIMNSVSPFCRLYINTCIA